MDQLPEVGEIVWTTCPLISHEEHGESEPVAPVRALVAAHIEDYAVLHDPDAESLYAQDDTTRYAYASQLFRTEAEAWKGYSDALYQLVVKLNERSRETQSKAFQAMMTAHRLRTQQET